MDIPRVSMLSELQSAAALCDRRKMRVSWFCFTFILGLLTPLTAGLASAQEPAHRPATYTVTDLGTLGGPYSYAYGLNDLGVVAGGAATPNQTNGLAQTAFIWDGGRLVSLGTLAGEDCPDCASAAGGPTDFGDSPVNSETAILDPYGEDFCQYGTHRQCLAAIWRQGSFVRLDPLQGGNNTSAFWENDLGETVGVSETSKNDPTCSILRPGQQFQNEAVKWGPGGHILQTLTPLPGDEVSFAFGINNVGQSVGASGPCSRVGLPGNNPPIAPHAVLWQPDGTPVELALPVDVRGDEAVATSINDQGEIVGGVILSDGQPRAMLWRRPTAQPEALDAPDAVLTVAPCCHVINNHGEVVGFGMDTQGNMKALLWKDNIAIDLNTVVPDSPMYLLQALSINNAGQIVGFGINTDTSELHAYLASPIKGVAPWARDRVVLSHAFVEMLRKKLHPVPNGAPH